MGYPLKIGLCNAQDPDTPDEETDGYRTFQPNDCRDIDDLKADVRDQFEKQPEHYGLKLHPAGNCQFIVRIQDVKLGGKYAPTVDWVERHVEVLAHFVKRSAGSAMFVSPQSSRPPSASQSTSIQAERKSVPTPPRPSPPRKKRANVSREGTFSGDIDPKETYYVRIGIQEKDPQQEVEELEMETLLVAEVNLAKRAVTYREVDSWVVNDVRVGDCQAGDPAKSVEQSGYWVHDAYFAQTFSKKSLKPRILELFRDGLPLFEPERFGQPQNAAPRPIALPIKPTIVGSIFPNDLDDFHGQGPNRCKEDVGIVFYFENRLDDEANLGFPISLQAAFGYNETCDQVRDYVMNGVGHGDFEGLKKLKKLDEYMAWNFQLWVLPQAPGCKNLYSWDNVSNLVSSDFLDENMSASDKYGRSLYVEVHLVPKEGYEDRGGGDTQKKGKRGVRKKSKLARASTTSLDAQYERDNMVEREDGQM